MSKFGIESLLSASAALEVDPEIVEMIKDDGSTLLHDAASGKATKIAPADMIEYSVVASKLNRGNCTALHLAILNGKILELLPRMIEKMSQESIEAASSADGNTALHYAIDRGRFDIASQLTSRMSPESLTKENPYKFMGSDKTQISALEFAKQKAAEASSALANSVAMKDGASAGHHAMPSFALSRGARRGYER